MSRFTLISAILIYLVILLVQNAECSRETNHFLVCTEILNKADWDPTSFFHPRCVSSNLEIESSRASFKQALLPNGTEVETSSIKVVEINTGKSSVKFMPAGIKKIFSRMISIDLVNSGLSHLEKDDMRQFGEDLRTANFEGNSLTALEGEIFEFNPNLWDLSFKSNPLKFVDPALFQNVKELKLLTVMRLQESGCTNQYLKPPPVTWTLEGCYDHTARAENIERIHERETFFLKFQVKEMQKEIDDLKKTRGVSNQASISQPELYAIKLALKKLQEENESIKNNLNTNNEKIENVIKGLF